MEWKNKQQLLSFTKEEFYNNKKFFTKHRIEGCAERMLINEELKPYNINSDDVIKNPEIDGKPWYMYYTFKTIKDMREWEKYVYDVYYAAYKNKKLAERAKAMFCLNYSLYCEEEHNYFKK